MAGWSRFSLRIQRCSDCKSLKKLDLESGGGSKIWTRSGDDVMEGEGSLDPTPLKSFFDAISHLVERACPSVRPSVRPKPTSQTDENVDY